jgi:hypothetical protein
MIQTGSKSVVCNVWSEEAREAALAARKAGSVSGQKDLSGHTRDHVDNWIRQGPPKEGYSSLASKANDASKAAMSASGGSGQASQDFKRSVSAKESNAHMTALKAHLQAGRAAFHNGDMAAASAHQDMADHHGSFLDRSSAGKGVGPDARSHLRAIAKGVK